MSETFLTEEEHERLERACEGRDDDDTNTWCTVGTLRRLEAEIDMLLEKLDGRS